MSAKNIFPLQLIFKERYIIKIKIESKTNTIVSKITNTIEYITDGSSALKFNKIIEPQEPYIFNVDSVNNVDLHEENHSQEIVEKTTYTYNGKPYNFTFIHNTPSNIALKAFIKELVKLS